jgi:predicted acyltransferase
MKHASWHGLTPTDLVFPFFLFAVGNAMAFVIPRMEAAGEVVFWKKVLKRTALIFLIGLFLNWWPFARWQDGQLVLNGWTGLNAEGKLSGVRIMGVLQRIALCYFFASVIAFYLKARAAFLTGLILLLLYWAFCIGGNPNDPYSLTGWFGNEIDKIILREVHMYKGEGITFDPEGLMSTIPAIVQVIFGYLVGNYILKLSSVKIVDYGGQMTDDGGQMTDNSSQNREPLQTTNFVRPVDSSGYKVQTLYRILTGLFIAAMGFLLAGYIWGLSFPVNKKIWTSSYVVLTTGMAIAILATLIYAIEIKNIRGWWTRFFDVFGKNALFVFALSAFLPKGLRLIRIPNGLSEAGKQLYVSPWNWLYEKIYKFVPGAPEIGSLLFALTVILFMWAICYWMDKKRIYVKV